MASRFPYGGDRSAAPSSLSTNALNKPSNSELVTKSNGLTGQVRPSQDAKENTVQANANTQSFSQEYNPQIIGCLIFVTEKQSHGV